MENKLTSLSDNLDIVAQKEYNHLEK